MASSKRKRSGPPPAAAAVSVASVLGNDVLLTEILLRLDLPTWLVRAALVCRRWLRRASDQAFLRRFRGLHPPRVLALRVVGLWFGSEVRILPIPQPPGLAAAARRAVWNLRRSDVCHCRNGRLLVEMEDPDPTMSATYAIRRLLHPTRDVPLPQPPPSRSSSLVPHDSGGIASGRRLFLLEDGHDSTACLCLNLTYNEAVIGADISILKSGVSSAERSTVTELPQFLLDTMRADNLLVGNKFYMMTTLGYILGLDLTTASFFTLQLPDGVRSSSSLKFSRPQHSGLYLIAAKRLQLCVWHCDDLGHWAWVHTISVRKACGHLNVRRWVPNGHRKLLF
ncbi:hypothetical protein PR202_gb08403 [Eleusine coracana subsp. coracana]|uniref:F-box domain-containing protein n=1 Tax=Eleusine coracana subsp. coracana TaxID=191504 RepID=A0AAV5EEI2_ELECO|nr:hypothetical protein QOZ80_2BG0184810 [Eleusine coracana subsp. coracana]GJN20962.1 hypothetical protein PR202_gb08403 [Eleusine coracana subsp. coracana]